MGGGYAKESQVLMTASLDDFTNPAAAYGVLSCRSVLDNIAVPMHCSTQDELAVKQLLERNLMVWKGSVDVHPKWRGCCDIYHLTETGQELCDQAGIRRH